MHGNRVKKAGRIRRLSSAAAMPPADGDQADFLRATMNCSQGNQMPTLLSLLLIS